MGRKGPEILFVLKKNKKNVKIIGEIENVMERDQFVKNSHHPPYLQSSEGVPLSNGMKFFRLMRN